MSVSKRPGCGSIDFDEVPLFLYCVSRQNAIDHGELIRWTKGFGAANTEGHDVAAMFRKSLSKIVYLPSLFSHCLSIYDLIYVQQYPITLTALINDTTGTLVASRYVNPRTKIAVIFGTGCNAAYMENVGDIEKINDLNIDPKAEMAINCEWVGFVNPGYSVVDESLNREPLILSNMKICLGQSMTLL